MMWIVVAAAVGAAAGIFLAALMCAAGRADDRAAAEWGDDAWR